MSFIPTQEKEKLGRLGDAANVLGPAFDNVAFRKPPPDEELQKRLASTAATLQSAASQGEERPESRALRRLANVLDRLKAATPAVRTRAELAVTAPLHVTLDQIRAELEASPVTVETLPLELVEDWMTRDGRARLQVLPSSGRTDNEFLRHFSAAVLHVAPNATGAPISTSASGDSVVEAFLQAGVYSAAAIVVLLALVLRRGRDVLLSMAPAPLWRP